MKYRWVFLLLGLLVMTGCGYGDVSPATYEIAKSLYNISNRKLSDQTDAYLAMYHDQGLPVLKYASFGAAVNVTLGLPIIRTSVDHGTAFDLAGTGQADCSSFYAAIELAQTTAQTCRLSLKNT